MPIRTRGPGGSLLLIGASILVGLNIVYSNPEYRFDGRIGKEHVVFSEGFFGENYLTVTKADGRIFKYVDTDNDFNLEHVTIKDGEILSTYRTDSLDPRVRELSPEFQREFDSYLEAIIERNKAP